MRGNDQVVAVNCEIANGSDRQIELQGLPVVTIVERYVNPEFGSGKEQPFLFRVFAIPRAGKRWTQCHCVISCQVAP